jgi:hypothetical protein
MFLGRNGDHRHWRTSLSLTTKCIRLHSQVVRLTDVQLAFRATSTPWRIQPQSDKISLSFNLYSHVQEGRTRSTINTVQLPRLRALITAGTLNQCQTSGRSLGSWTPSKPMEAVNKASRSRTLPILTSFCQHLSHKRHPVVFGN